MSHIALSFLHGRVPASSASRLDIPHPSRKSLYTTCAFPAHDKSCCQILIASAGFHIDWISGSALGYLARVTRRCGENVPRLMNGFTALESVAFHTFGDVAAPSFPSELARLHVRSLRGTPPEMAASSPV